ncbi:unnamed protein product [Prorocentrum cordatum]|uniref:Uncharacterized protein n=1 Tax=Prorocentrum cordatum TaxID=2364126 RepID=A0ABN9RCJ8_9DINO|nr:unnamed protein product [Polarella glacialis]|mmetsp:Transcript_14896/g.39390  ORF Transcript_14896/g.39390 Transcript_14896/m.39390 type:complete len:207 (+) Transcript_14896:99-719(+)
MAPKTCPLGHSLGVWEAEAGSCDGCRRVIRDGDLVMDCRRCNYYLCNECYNDRSSLWMSLASFIPDCTADTRAPSATEVVCDGDNECASTVVVDPRCDRRTHKDSNVAGDARDARQHEETPDEVEAPTEPQTTKSAAETVDLLGDLLSEQTPQPRPVPAAPKPAVRSAAAELAAELAAPPDLGLLGAKGQEAPKQSALQAARYGAA